MITFNLDFIFVGISILGILILGTAVYINNKKSITNRSFFYFSIAAVLWGLFNYLNYQFKSPDLVLWSLRAVIFFAVWYCFFLFQFLYVFPLEKISFPKKYKYILVPIVIVVSIINLSNLVFPAIAEIGNTGEVSKTVVGHGIFLFIAVVLFLIISGIYSLIKKIIKATQGERTRLRLIFWGVSITFVFHIIFNLILPAVFLNVSFMPLGAVFTFPFIIFTSYSIIRHKLFNIKIIATELITFALWVFVLIRMLLSANLQDRVVNGLLFVAVAITGIFLINSVMKEVKQRQQLEIITGQLEAANEQLKSLDKLKTEFLSLAAHQLRSPLTAMKGYASMILEGSYGEVPEKQKEPINRIFESSNHLAKVINDFLNVSKIEQGGMKYEMAPFDVEKAAHDLATDLAVTAKNKGLELTFSTDNQPPYTSYGDMEKLRQVFLNLIDNSIKYTAQGFIKVKIEKNVAAGTITFSVTDSGMGISKETMATLFQKFARGEGGKVNTSGSGLGLYLAKEIVAAHKGRVWIESPGVGKGSTFFVELPMNKS